MQRDPQGVLPPPPILFFFFYLLSCWKFHVISLCAQAVDFLCKSFLCSYCLSDITLFVHAKLLRIFWFGWRLCGFPIAKFPLATMRSIARASETEHKEKEHALLGNAWCTRSHVGGGSSSCLLPLSLRRVPHSGWLCWFGTAVTGEPGRSVRRSSGHSCFRVHSL